MKAFYNKLGFSFSVDCLLSFASSTQLAIPWISTYYVPAGVDCPSARDKMSQDPKNSWMLPKCQKDGTFKDLQCFDQYPDVPDTCMCCAPDGTPLTLPWFGLDVKSCVCFLAQYNVFEHDPNAELLKCEKTGFFASLQCSDISKKCWCVDKNGNVLVPPSSKVHSCDN